MVTLCFAFAACGDDGDSGSGGSSGKSPVAGKKIAMAFFAQPSLPPLRSIACGAREEGRRRGFDMLEPQGPQQPFDVAGMAQVMQSLLRSQPDGLIYFPIDGTSGALPIKSAVADGLPVAILGTELADPSLAISYLSTNQNADAKVLGDLLSEQIDRSGKVAVMGTLPGNSITIARVAGFKEAVAKYQGIEIVSTSYPQLDVNKFAGEATALLTKHPDLEAFYATNDTIASGIATALRQADKVGKVKLITWDLQPGVIKMLREGVVTGTIGQQARLLGKLAVEQLASKLAGKPTQPRVEPVDEMTVTPATLESPEVKAFIKANYSPTSC